MIAKTAPLPRCVVAIAIAVSACGGAREDTPPSGTGPTPPGASPPISADAPSCDGSALHDLAVASDDLNGYPPYALAECSLVYVNAQGELVLRDLSTTAETTLAPATERPRRPSVSVDVDGPARRQVVVWEATLGAGSVVRVRYDDRVHTIAGEFMAAGEPRVRGRFVAFTAWNGAAETDDTDVWLYDARTELARRVLGGPAQQRFADVSATHVVATDFTEDPDGRFDGSADLADLLVFDIATGAITRRAAPGKQAFPMLSNDGVVGYLAWNGVHPEPKLRAYDLKAGPLFGDPTADRTIAHVNYASAEPARPALADGMLEWIANPDGVTALYRAPIDGAAAPARVLGLEGLVLYAPATASGGRTSLTVLAAATGTDRAPRLRGIPR